MEVTSIQDGIIIDHIPAGRALSVIHFLGLDPTRTRMALIMNTRSERYGSKDIIKIEQEATFQLDILGFVAPQASINIVKAGKIVSKRTPGRPLSLVNVIRCSNPRCVTTVEGGIDQGFHLDTTGGQPGVYRCDYCDEEAELS